MTSVPRQKTLELQLKDMETRLRRLERMTNLVSASIGSGGLVIRDNGNLTIQDGGDLRIMDDGTLQLFSEDGEEIVLYVGGLELSGQNIGRGLVIRTENGVPIAQFSTNDLDGTNWASIYDSRGNEVIATDRSSGYGLSFPRHHYPFVKNDVTQFFSTTSSAFVLAYTGYASLSNPELLIGVVTSISGTATGTVQVKIDGVAHSSQAFSGATFLTFVVEASTLSGANPDHQAQVQIELRRTSGTGTVFCQPEYMVGRRNT